MAQEQRQQRYEVRKIKADHQIESEVVSKWDSYLMAKQEALKLSEQTGIFHWVRDIENEPKQ